MSAVKKMQIARFAPQIEKVDNKAALELWESIRVCVDAIYAKVIIIINTIHEEYIHLYLFVICNARVATV